MRPISLAVVLALSPSALLAAPAASLIRPSPSEPLALAREALTDCQFTYEDKVMALQADCSTDGTLFIPEGHTLVGGGFTITAVDPADGHFVGAMLQNEGGSASVSDVRLRAAGLADVCDSKEGRLAGVRLRDASGIIEAVSIEAMNQAQSSCQEGNGIEVYTSQTPTEAPVEVEIRETVIQGWQKTGALINGNVRVIFAENDIGSSVNQALLAANGLQLSYGATGRIEGNLIEGNSWAGGGVVATAVTVFEAGPGLQVIGNLVLGDSDIALNISADDGSYLHNRLIDRGADSSPYDMGINNLGVGNSFALNRALGFEEPYVNVEGVGNR